MSVALISGIVVPHWKLTLTAASMLPRATCGKFSAAFASCTEPKSWTSTLPLVRAFTSAAKPCSSLVRWRAGGPWGDTRMTTGCAMAIDAPSANSAKASQGRNERDMRSPPDGCANGSGCRSAAARAAIGDERVRIALQGGFALALRRQSDQIVERVERQQLRQAFGGRARTAKRGEELAQRMRDGVSGGHRKHDHRVADRPQLVRGQQ